MRRANPQVRIVSDLQRVPAGPLGQVALRLRLHAPRDASDQVLPVVRPAGFAVDLGVPVTQLRGGHSRQLVHESLDVHGWASPSSAQVHPPVLSPKQIYLVLIYRTSQICVRVIRCGTFRNIFNLIVSLGSRQPHNLLTIREADLYPPAFSIDSKWFFMFFAL